MPRLTYSGIVSKILSEWCIDEVSVGRSIFPRSNRSYLLLPKIYLIHFLFPEVKFRNLFVS